MMNEAFMLYANCVPVKGHTRTAICDLQRQSLHFVPNSMIALFNDVHFLIVDVVLSELEKDEHEILWDYLRFLEVNELGFFCAISDIERFSKLSTEWLFPGQITNCIMDADDNLWYIDGKLLQQLDALGCDYLQIRFYKNVSFEHLQTILRLLSASRMKAVEIFIPKSDTPNFYLSAKELIAQFPQVQTLFVHSDTISEIVQSGKNGMGFIITTTHRIFDRSHCGVVSTDYFSINIPHFTESLVFNTCLHRKISIDTAGYIRNCPSMQDSFGNISDTLLQEAIKKPGFSKYWDTKKDLINVCKDCEFRHVCSDCRAYVEDPKDIYSKPLKCGYDPYTGIWEDWTESPLKQKARNYYNL